LVQDCVNCGIGQRHLPEEGGSPHSSHQDVSLVNEREGRSHHKTGHQRPFEHGAVPQSVSQTLADCTLGRVKGKGPARLYLTTAINTVLDQGPPFYVLAMGIKRPGEKMSTEISLWPLTTKSAVTFPIDGLRIMPFRPAPVDRYTPSHPGT